MGTGGLTAKSGGGSSGASDAAAGAQRRAGDAAEQFKVFGRAGWVAKGAVYAVLGVLFIGIAVDGGGSGGSGAEGGEEASQTGAVEAIASSAFGGWLLWALALGIALYVLWRLFSVVLPGDWTGAALAKRIGYAVGAAVYISLLITIVDLLRNRGTSSGEDQDRLVETWTRSVLEAPAGRFLVGAAGLVVVGLGAWFARVGWKRDYRSELTVPGGIEGSAIDRLGMVGWIARGVAVILVGVFLIRAAWLFQPDEAAGFDEAVSRVATNPVGAVLIALVGAGFVAYGLFAGLSARYQRLEGPRNDG